MSDKNILEKALLQVNQLEEAVKQNAQGILASTMKQGIKDLLKESEEEEEIETEAFQSTENDQENDMSEQFEDESEEDEDTDTETEDETTDDEFSTEDVDGEPETDMGTDDETFDDEEGEEEDVLDMTDAPDEDVLKVFKSMKPEDGIIVKKDGNDISLEMDDDDYIIKLDGETDSVDTDFSDDETEETEDEEETIYEIDLGGDSTNEKDFIWYGPEGKGGDEETSTEENPDTELSEDEEEVEEAARTLGNDVRKPADQGKKFKSGRPELNEAIKEIEKLRKQNGLYKQTINAIKGKLNEIALFNSNLTHSTRLFTEHSTTRAEKKNILKRFDGVSTITESTKLYDSIKLELQNNKPVVSENVVNKIKSTNNTSSNDLLSESKAYENPQLERIKQLMGWSQK